MNSFNETKENIVLKSEIESFSPYKGYEINTNYNESNKDKKRDNLLLNPHKDEVDNYLISNNSSEFEKNVKKNTKLYFLLKK